MKNLKIFKYHLSIPLCVSIFLFLINNLLFTQTYLTQEHREIKREFIETTLLDQIADWHARMLWGKEIARDLPIQMYDKHGSIISYLYQFTLNQSHFDQEILFKKIELILTKYDFAFKQDEVFKLPEEFYYELKHVLGEFGTIYISAIYSEPPVIDATKSIHPYFITSRITQRKAEHVLENDNVKLERIYFLGHDNEYYEFASEERNVLLKINSLAVAEFEEVINNAPEKLTDPRAYEIVKEYWKYFTEAPQKGLQASDLTYTTL